jgi:hypothetical protein
MTQKSLLQSAGDGTAVPAGYVGEVVQANLTANQTLVSISDVDLNGLSLSLGAGVWLISYSLSVDVTTTTANGHTNFAQTRITDSSNNLVGNSIRCAYVKNSGSGTNADNICTLHAQEAVNISSQTTYKVRAKVGNLASAGTIQQDTTYGQSKFMAVRIA